MEITKSIAKYLLVEAEQTSSVKYKLTSLTLGLRYSDIRGIHCLVRCFTPHRSVNRLRIT